MGQRRILMGLWSLREAATPSLIAPWDRFLAILNCNPTQELPLLSVLHGSFIIIIIIIHF